MVKVALAMCLILTLASCSSSIPAPPEPSGKRVPVNPTIVYVSDMEV